MGMHEGHRQRLKDRFRKEGLDNFSDINVLELLLFYCIPRMDTNPIAHRLLDHFGSLPLVLDATPEELAKVPGVGENVATFLSLMTAVGRFYRVKSIKEEAILSTIEECGEYLSAFFFGKENETVYMLCLDAKCKVLCCKKVGEGSINSANIPVRRIVEMALAANATTVVLAHNHPSGLAIPSIDDIRTTHKIAAALETVEITLSDHLVISNDEYVSIAQSRYYSPGDGGITE
jgi:DNA repair protein RadC